MKRLNFFVLGLFLFLSCGGILPPSYGVKLPELPPPWREILGECRWRVEWIGPSGLKESMDCGASVSPELAFQHAWPNPVLAWPYWPEKSLYPGMFRPAGALYPLDVSGRDMVLSWEAGPEALFYLALDEAWGLSETPQDLRRPQYFDWSRFRDYLRHEAPAAVLADPWLVNWKTAARNAVQSGFRITLIKADTEPADVIIPAAGPWIGSSPFQGPFPWTAGETVSLGLKTEAEILVSPGGIFVVSRDGQLWAPW